jgi:phosphate starvation-inducible PhoH-like protein
MEPIKKVLKNKISKFNTPLQPEQKQAKSIILDNDITLLKGEAGSSKTFLACNVGLDLLFRKEVSRIYVARPFVYGEKEKIGALPGGVNEKLVGITTPIIDNMYKISDKGKIDELIANGAITILPVAFMKGMTLDDSFIILDEFQNATLPQVHTALSRLGKFSKMVITGDMTQCDLGKNESGFGFFDKLESEGIIKIVTLTGDYRHAKVKLINKAYQEYK